MRTIGAALVLAMCLAGPAAGAEPFTLDEALGVTYETNPQLDAQRASLRATDEEVARANAGWRPTINATGSAGTQHYEIDGAPINLNSHPVQAQVIINQPILRGGRTYAQISRAKALVRAGRAQLAGTEQTVLLAAVSAYMDVVRDTAIVDLRRHNVAVLDKQARATKIQFDAGDLTRTDVAQSDARLAGARSELTTAEGQLAVSRANFEQVVGRPAESLDTMPPPPPLPASEEEARTLALKQHPTLVSAREAERAADYAIDDSVGAMLPQLSLQGQYGYSRDSLNTSGLGGGTGEIRTTALLAQLTVPIYQGGADQANVRQAKELHSQSQLNADNAERIVTQGARAAWEAYQSARGTIVSSEQQAKANELAFNGVSREQQVGGRTVLDVLNAQQELLNSQVAVVVSRRNAEVAAYQLLAASGQLSARNLGLKVKLYDPLEHYDDDAARWLGF